MALVSKGTSTDVVSSFKEVQQQIRLRTDRWRNHPWKENSFLVPLPCRRTSPIISEFLPLTPFRSKSARASLGGRALATPTRGMQRHSSSNNVSVARLFDWSEPDSREERLSVSRLYREIAGAGASLSRSLAEKTRSPVPANVGASGSGGSRMNPGRMFLRDKGMLTKGEREIIEGIYKNRGDLRKDGLVPHRSASRSELHVRSHHDAWLVGKPGLSGNKPSTEVARDAPRSALMEVSAPVSASAASPEYSRRDAGNSQSQPKTTCLMCLKEQQQLLQQNKAPHQHSNNHHRQRKGAQPTAPPPPPLPANSILRPININDTFRPRGEEGEEGPNAPPTSPAPKASPAFPLPSSTSTHSNRLLTRRTDPTTTTSGSTAARHNVRAWEVNGESRRVITEIHGSDSEDSVDSVGSKRKVQVVKVILPQVVSEVTEADDFALPAEEVSSISTLSRERHLSHSDLKSERRKSGGGGGMTNHVHKRDCKTDRAEEAVTNEVDEHCVGNGENGEAIFQTQKEGKNCDHKSPQRKSSFPVRSVTVLNSEQEISTVE